MTDSEKLAVIISNQERILRRLDDQDDRIGKIREEIARIMGNLKHMEGK